MGVYLLCSSAASRAGCRNRKPKAARRGAGRATFGPMILFRIEAGGWSGGSHVGHIHPCAGRGFDARPGAARTPAVGPFPRSGHRRAGDHLDPRRPRSHARRLRRARLEGKPGAAILGFRGRPRRQRLSARRSRRRAVLRLAHRPARTQEALLHHHRRLPRRHGDDRTCMERLLLLCFPFLHRLRHRRRIFRHQFDHPGAGPGALPRSTRPHHQRQLLGRGGARRSGRRRAAQSGARPFRVRMAPCLPDRRCSWRRRLLHADVDSREPALARDPRPGKGGRDRRYGNRKAIPRSRRRSQGGRPRRRHAIALARPYAACGSVRHADQSPSRADLRRARR